MLWLILAVTALVCRFLFHQGVADIAYWCFVVWCVGQALGSASIHWPTRNNVEGKPK